MTSASRIIGIILCAILIIADLAFLAPAAIGFIGTRQGKGTRFGLAFDNQKTAPPSPEEIKQAIDVLGERLKKLGVSNAIIEQSKVKGEAIVVFLPPVADKERVANLLNAQSLLELRPVAKGTSLPYETKEEAETAARALEGGLDKYEVMVYRPRVVSGAAPTGGWVVLEKTPAITNADMSSVKANRSQYGGGNWEIDFQLTPAAAERFARVTADNIGNYLAIILNNEVRSAPSIQSQIRDRGRITGGFSQQSAEDVALVLSTGSLPRRLFFVSEQIFDMSKWPGGHVK